MAPMNSTALLRTGFTALLLAPISAIAQTCTLPAPLSYLGNVQGFSEWTGAAGTNCGLRTRIDNSGRLASGAYAAGIVAEPRKRLRASFHVDFSGLDAMTPLQSTTLLSLVASAAPDEPLQTAAIARFGIAWSNPGSSETAALVASRAANEDPLLHRSGILSSRSIDVALEAIVGASGIVRYWINAGFDDPPTGSLAVDNAPWQAIAGIALGEFSSTAPFNTRQGDRDIVFTDIRVDEYLFWDHFD
jgi:hypothetical protein